jgi:hypothetical protein
MKMDANSYFRQRIAIDKALECITKYRRKLIQRMSNGEVDFFETMLKVTGALMDRQTYSEMPRVDHLPKEEVALMLGEMLENDVDIPKDKIVNLFLEASNKFGKKIDPSEPLFADSFYEMIGSKFTVAET